MSKVLHIIGKVCGIAGLSILLGFLSYNVAMEQSTMAWSALVVALISYCLIVFFVVTD